MENKRFFLLTVLVSMSLLLALTGPSAASAQEEQPPSPVPLRSISPHSPGYNQSLNPGIPEDRAELIDRSKSAVPQPRLDAQAVTLGQPGLSFRYVQTFGTTGEPYLADGTHLDKPNGLFIDGSNNLYTVEENGHRLLRFDSSGVNNMIIGHAGQPWAHDDFLAWPRDVAKDPNGNIWVVFNNAALKEFDSSGNPLQVFPENEPWVQGTANDRFNTPWGIAFGPNGYMYVSDQGNHRIQVYNISGGTPAYVQTIGQTGVPHSDNGGFNQPGQIAFDSLGRLYVVDSFGGNFRVQRCTKTASWTCQTFFGQTGVQGNDLSHLSWAAGITIRNDVIYIADGGNYRVLKCTTAGICTNFAGVSAVGGSDNSHFWFVADVAVDSSGNVFVSDIDNFRIQKFNSAGVYQSTIGVTGVPYLTDSSHINSPWGVAVNTSGDVYAVENMGYRLLKFNSAGSQQWAVGTPGAPGNDNSHLGNSPEGNPAVDAGGRVYVADTNNQRVQIYNSNGSYFATMGTGQWGSGNNEFAVPNGIAISPVNGDIYVADMGNHRIQVFNSARVYKATLGTPEVPGSDNLHFNWPRGVAVAPNGTIYVTDSENFRVQKCSFTTGVNYTCSLFAGQTGGAPDGSYDRIHPIAAAVDANGRVYVVDDWNGRIMVYNSAGAFLTSIGGNWTDGTGGLRFPAGVAVDSAGNVYVTDHDNQRLQKFAPGVPGWQQSNIDGFGDPRFGSTLSMAVFNNQLYAGAGNWSGAGASIWRTSNGVTWSPAMTSGFGSPSVNPAVIGMIAFKGKLYAGTGWGGAPGQLWRSSDGTAWSQVTGNGLGTTSNAIGTFAVYGDNLYAGTCSGDGAPGAQIWRSATGDNLTWTTVVTGGRTTADNNCVTSLKVFNGALYAAVENTVSGAQIWRSATGNGGTWTQVNTSGFGSPSNDRVGGFAIYGGYLYIGTNNLSTGGQLWRSNNGTTWNPVNTDGFGDVNNNKLESLFVFDDALYAAFNNFVTGLEVWRSSDGTNWDQVNPDGFGSSNNASTLWSNETVAFNGALYLGVGNGANGTEIWRSLPMTLSGTTGVAGTTLSYTEATTKTATSLLNGNYSFTLPYSWQGIVTPSHTCFTFNPISRNYPNVIANQTGQNYSPTIIPGCADIGISVGGVNQARFGVPSPGSTRTSFVGLSNGPVKIQSTNAVPIMGAERVIYKVNNVNTSFSEMMALPDSQLDTTYWLPWYNSVSLNTQLRIANVSNTAANIQVVIGGTPMGSFTLAAGASARKNYPSIDKGPVQIISNVNIIAAERVIYSVNGVNTSYSELMALPSSQLDATYWLPWYNSKSLDTQLRIANVSAGEVTVTVTIGGAPAPGSPFTLALGASKRLSFPDIDKGPVKIESTGQVIASERVIYKLNGAGVSFSETMALPNSQLDTTYWLPWYNNKSTDSQLRIANVSDTEATVNVSIGGAPVTGSPFTISAGGSKRLSFAGIDKGPVKIESNVNVVAAERVIYRVNSVVTSFSEMMGLPNSQVDTIYWLPWYNNQDLDTQLRFGAP